MAPRQQWPRSTMIFFWPLTTVMSTLPPLLTPSTTTFWCFDWSVSSVYAASSCSGFVHIPLAEHFKSSVMIICCSGLQKIEIRLYKYSKLLTHAIWTTATHGCTRFPTAHLVQSVGTKRYCAPRFNTARPHHSSVAPAALTTSPSSRPVQDCLSCSSRILGTSAGNIKSSFLHGSKIPTTCTQQHTKSKSQLKHYHCCRPCYVYWHWPQTPTARLVIWPTG